MADDKGDMHMDRIKQSARKFGCVLRDIYGWNSYSLDCYPAKTGKVAPFALICPGGGYTFVMSSVEGQPYADKLNELGYSAFVVRYRRRKKAHYPAPMEDIAKALAYILDNADTLNVRRDGYSLWGSSAGGHAAACFASEKYGWKHYGLPRPAALILTYPVITMGDLTHEGSRRYFLGKNPTKQEISEWSADNLVTTAYPPTYIWNSKADEVVLPENSRMLVKKMEIFRVEHRYHLFESGAHGCGLGTGTECEVWFLEAISFWKHQIKKDGETHEGG